MDKLNSAAWKRLDAVRRIKQAALTVVEAAKLLGVTDRQVRRIVKAVGDRGAQGVVHGNAGRSPAHRLNASVQKRVVKLMRGKYTGFNDKHFTEKLVEVEKIEVSRATVQRLLRAAGIGAARKRRPPKHRRRRDRKPQAGQMILWDGSRHDWLEGRGPMLCLMGAIDDATSEMLPGAYFVEQECAEGYLRVLLTIAREKGVPWSAYMDRHGSLKRNDNFWTLAEELRGKQDPTQVLRALEFLEVEVIYALSAQAKGRIERLWGTAQDRLTSELRLAKARTVEEANAVLREYTPDHNRRFAVPASDVTPAWRPVRKGLDLERACSFRYGATVSNDNAVRLAGAPIIDIPPGRIRQSFAKARVEVRQYLDGSWRVFLRDVEMPAFSRHREEYLSDPEFLALQQLLLDHPEAGDVIQGTGGLRKLRFADERRGKGRRGGLRVIYFWWTPGQQCWLFTVYGKGELSDLTTQERKAFRALLKAELEARS